MRLVAAPTGIAGHFKANIRVHQGATAEIHNSTSPWCPRTFGPRRLSSLPPPYSAIGAPLPLDAALAPCLLCPEPPDTSSCTLDCSCDPLA
eukprot:scaffold298519_cov37-Tisochrysis_lutea.AAC.3